MSDVDMEEAKSQNCPELIRSCFDRIYGMDSLKRTLTNIYYMNQIGEERFRCGIGGQDYPYSHNIVIKGQRGCGKTTAAKCVGECFANMKIIYDRDFYVVDLTACMASDGHESDEEHFIDKIAGKIILIDDVEELLYQNTWSVFFGMIDRLVGAYHESRGAFVIVITGEDESVERLMHVRRDLAELFVVPAISIKDYTDDDIINISHKMAEDMGFILETDADRILLKEFKGKQGKADYECLNTLKDIIVDASLNAASRMAGIRNATDLDLALIGPEDFKNNADSTEDEQTLKQSLDKLNGLVGLNGVKEQVNTMISSVRVNQLRAERGLPAQQAPSLHLIFKGNPGTGKTTVARIIGEIYRKLGILSTGGLVECTRSDLVGEYQGHTAKKMKEKIEEAMGGILFIDEAYSLVNGPFDSFGQEAINELVPAMENNRENLMIIVAGYTDEMNEFLNSNPGLRSRFARELVFEDYTHTELVDIFVDTLRERGLHIGNQTDGDEESIHGEIEDMIATCITDSDFGNARGVRNLVDMTIQIQESRIAGMIDEGGKITDEMLQSIDRCDIEKVALMHGEQ